MKLLTYNQVRFYLPLEFVSACLESPALKDYLLDVLLRECHSQLFSGQYCYCSKEVRAR